MDYNTLPHGGRADQPSEDDATPLDIVKLLLERGANPNLQLKMFPPYRATGNDRGLDGMLTIGTTPLIRAAKAQDVDAMKLLLEHGASVEIANSQGILPVVAAAGVGSSDRDARGNYRLPDIQDRGQAAIELLLKHGAKINDKGGRQQQAALHGAAYWGWDKVSAWLLEQGADVNIADSRGLTPLDVAENRGGNPGNTIDVSAGRKAAADVLKAKGGVPGTPLPQVGRPGAPPAR